jgi:Short C-terminal domain
MALLAGAMARTAVAAGVAADARKRASRRQKGRWAAQGGPGAPQPAAPGPESAAVTELRGLAELRAEGILTEEEFTAKKRRVLGI